MGLGHFSGLREGGSFAKKRGGGGIFEEGLIPQWTLRNITEDINSLNSKQREVINVVYTWAKDYIKYNGHSVEHVQ